MPRYNITLDEDEAAQLERLASRAHVQAGTLARSLLLTAIAGADPEASNLVSMLDGIDGSFEAAQRGSEEVRAGRIVPFRAG